MIGWPRRTSWVVGLANTLGYANYGAMPWVIGALVEGRGLSVVKAGLLGTVELGAMGVAMAIMSPFADRLTARTAVPAGLAVAALAQVLTIATRDFTALLFIRALSGCAFAALYCMAAAEGARSAEPVRIFAFASLVTLTLGAFKVLVLGQAKAWNQADGVFFGLLAYYVVIGLPLILLCRGAGGSSARARPSAERLSIAAVAGALSIMGLYSLATGAVWSFAVEVATRVGIGSAELGRRMALLGLLGLLGGVAAERLGTRLGRAIPTVSSLLASGFACVLLMRAADPASYWGALIVWIILSWFTYPYVLGLAAHFDPAGRLAAATAATLILLAAAGTLLSGLLAANFGPAAIGWAGLSTCVLAAAIVVVLLLPGVVPKAARPAAISAGE